MADTETTTDTTEAPEAEAVDTAADTEQLGDAGKKALQAERKAAREAEKRAAAAEARVKEFEDAQKTESEKTTERATKAEETAATATARAEKAERALAVYLNAGDADPARLLKNVDFLDAIADLEADDTDGIKKAITAAVKESPWLKRVGITGGDTAAGHGKTVENVKPGTSRMAAAFDARYQQ